MSDWADYGDDFIVFLKAYGHISDIGKVDTNVLSESRINALWSSHKDRFNSWLKCPQLLKDKYHNKIPYFILDKAATDPNFTEADAIKADEEYQKSQNPYSVVPDSLLEHPAYEQLCSCGVKFSLAHIAAMKLMSETYARGGYSYQNAQKVGSEYAIRGALLSKRAETEANSNLSDTERTELLKVIDEQHLFSRQRELEAKTSELRLHPERALMRLLFEMHRKHISPEEASQKISQHLQKIVASDKLSVLANEMAGSKYQKVINAEEKQFFANILRVDGIDMSHLNKMQNELITDGNQTQSSSSTAYKISALRGLGSKSLTAIRPSNLNQAYTKDTQRC